MRGGACCCASAALRRSLVRSRPTTSWRKGGGGIGTAVERCCGARSVGGHHHPLVRAASSVRTAPVVSPWNGDDAASGFYGARGYVAAAAAAASSERGRLDAHRRGRGRTLSAGGTSRSLSSSATSAESYFDSVAASTKNAWSYDRNTGIATSSSARYQTVIGLEIHAQLASPTKLLSGAPTRHHPLYAPSYRGGGVAGPASPNSLVSPYDASHPGTLPVLSLTSVKLAVISTAALGCQINPVSRFERKHYHYADLPAGYQVTQQRWPLGGEGVLRCRRWVENTAKKKKKKRGKEKDEQQNNGDGSEKQSMEEDKFFEIGIDRVQLEVDTGKTTALNGPDGSTTSLIDLNRVNSPLIEIVFRPDIRSAHEAAAVVTTVQNLLKFVGTCDGRMERGSLRVDLNVSVARLPPVPPSSAMNACAGTGEGKAKCGDDASSAQTGRENKDEQLAAAAVTDDDEDDDNPFASSLPPFNGPRTEVKNLNSIRQIVLATEYEVLRQAALTEASLTGALTDGSGAPPRRETRTYDVKHDKTVKMRDKGGAVDYRFMPEPDLPPLRLDVLNGSSNGGRGDDGKGGGVLGTDHRTLTEFLEGEVPELPEDIVGRFIAPAATTTVDGNAGEEGGRRSYGLDEDVALVIASDPAAVEMFEEAVETAWAELSEATSEESLDGNEGAVDVKRKLRDRVPSSVANWLTNDLFKLVKESAEGSGVGGSGEGDGGDDAPMNHPASVQYSSVDGMRLGSLVAAVLEGTVSTTQGKKILAAMHREEDDGEPNLGPREIAQQRGWTLITDMDELRSLCRSVVTDADNAMQLGQYREGGERKVRKVRKFFLGSIMKRSGGNAHPERAAVALDEVLEEVMGGVGGS